MILAAIIAITRTGIHTSTRCIAALNEREVVSACAMKEDIVHTVGTEPVGSTAAIVDDIVTGPA